MKDGKAAGLTLVVAGLLTMEAAAAVSRPASQAPPPASQAAANPRLDLTQASTGSQKYLFVVDVSETMERFDYDGRAPLFDLIQSGIYGHMRPGDTFGLWPFNEGVFAGLYPMKRWDPVEASELAGHATHFLKDRSLSGKARLDRVMPVILNVVTNVGDLNVFIISDGKSKLVGTPFDGAINKTYKRRASDAKKARQPFVTLLLARQGEVITAGVTVGGEEISMPPRIDPPPKETNATAVATASPAPSKSNATGSKPPQSHGAATVGAKPAPPTGPPPPTNAQPAAADTPAVRLPAAAQSNEATPVPFQAPSLPPAGTDTLSQGPASSAPVPAPPPGLELQTSGGEAHGPSQSAEPPPPKPSEPAGTGSGEVSLVERLAPAPVQVAARELPDSGAGVQTNEATRPALATLTAPGATRGARGWFLWCGAGLIGVAAAVVGYLLKMRQRPAPSSFISQSIQRRQSGSG